MRLPVFQFKSACDLQPRLLRGEREREREREGEGEREREREREREI